MVKTALLIGVSSYQKGFDPLPSTLRDIAEFEGVLKDSVIGGFDSVICLENPEPKAMEKAIYDLFNDKKADDLILLYFSGHGVRDMKNQLYFTTPDTEKNQRNEVIPHTAVMARYIQERMGDSLSEHQVIILDCCYSGAFSKGLTAKDGGEINILEQLGGKGRAIFTSSSLMQQSFQQDESGLSLYTHYLLEGLKTGAADIDEDGWISADELHQYTSEKVQEAAPAMTPQFFQELKEGYKIKIAKAPLRDPKRKYRKEVERIVREDEGDIDFLTGEIDYLSRFILDELRLTLRLNIEECQIIEQEVMEPHRQRQEKIQRYQKAYNQALNKHNPLRNSDISKLQRFQELLGIREEDIEKCRGEWHSPKITNESVTEFINNNESPLSKPESLNPNLQLFSVPVQVPIVNRTGKIIKTETHTAQYFKEVLPGNIELEMAVIPGGKFFMGTEDEEIERLCKKHNPEYFKRESPQHQVTVPPFLMGKYPVTQAQWKAIALTPKIEIELKSEPSRFKGNDNHPVERVSWNQAVEYCKRLSRETGKEYRLSSEAEWEYGCRSQKSEVRSQKLEDARAEWNQKYNQPFYFGETLTGKLANYRAIETYADEPEGEYIQKTTPVGQFPPNGFGLYDMHGNVWEWCLDDYHNNYENAPRDGSAWIDIDNDNHSQNESSTKILRGGSWIDDPSICRSAFRDYISRDHYGNIVGFRVVRSSPRIL